MVEIVVLISMCKSASDKNIFMLSIMFLRVGRVGNE